MRTLLPTLLVMLPGWLAAQQPAWIRRSTVHSGVTATMLHDAARQRTMLIDQFDTYEWQNGRWAHRSEAQSRPSLIGTAAFDAGRGVAVVYSSGATWEHDGHSWTQRVSPTNPGNRVTAAAHDVARGRTVLFGGHSPQAMLDDTWEWDGVAWSLASPASHPTARTAHAMAYDPAGQQLLLFGGNRGPLASDETWGWNGTTWQQFTPATRPAARFDHSMALDPARGRVVLFGGLVVVGTMSTPIDDTWEWDGSSWSQATTSTRPTARSGATMAFEPQVGGVLLFGGTSLQHNETDTWSWNGSQWRWLAAGMRSSRRGRIVADPVRDEFVTFGAPYGGGAHADTLTGDGATWLPRNVVPSPPARSGASLVFDAARNEVLLFGGLGASDTWGWNGSAWQPKTPTASPSPGGHPMAWDPTNQRVLLCESHAANGVIEVWSWAGTNWQLHPVAVRPPSRWRPAATFDAIRQQLVMFGGYQSCGFACATNLADTWTWNGVQWTQANPTVAPPGRTAAYLVFDPIRQRVMMAGGFVRIESPQIWPQVWGWPLFDAWEWDGVTWQGLAVPVLMDAQPVIDPQLQRIVFYDGAINVLSVAGAAAWHFGVGCPGSVGEPWLATNQPTLGNAAFAIDVGSTPANAICVLGLGFAATNTPVGGSCTLLVASPITTILLATNGSGFASTAIAIPPVAALRGLVVVAQALVLDGAVPTGFSMTSGLRLGLGD